MKNTPTDDEPVILAKLAYYPDHHLFHRTELIKDFSAVPAIADLMFQTMLLNDGIGLAANQIKLNIRMFVMRIGDLRKAFINPTLEFPQDAKLIEHEERCLSFPGISVTMKRYNKCIIRYQDIRGESFVLPLDDELQSICAQHEVDHLDGKTFVDHMGKIRQMVATRTIKKTIKTCQEKKQAPPIRKL